MSKLIELITDCKTGELSHTKIWTHIAYLAATIAFVRITVLTDVPLPAEIWFIYLGVVGGHNVLNKWISMKYGATPNEAEEKIKTSN